MREAKFYEWDDEIQELKQVQPTKEEQEDLDNFFNSLSEGEDLDES